MIRGTRSSAKTRLALIFVASTALLACGNDPPSDDPDTGGVDGDVIEDPSVDTNDDEVTSAPDADSGTEDPDVDTGAEDPDTDTGTIEPDTDVGPDDPELDTDTGDDPDTGDGLPPEYFLQLCSTPADCSVAGAQCVRSVPLSREDPATDPATTSLTVQEIFGDRVPAGTGVCTVACSTSEDCGSVTGGDWACQVVATATSPYPSGAEFPFSDQLDADEMAAGQPFAAVCRPSYEVLEGELAETCRLCTGEGSCEASCWDPASSSIVDDHSDGLCVAACGGDEDCPLGTACEDVGDGAYCLPVVGTCDACLDVDGDGFGVGRCLNAGVDCDDLDPEVYYDPASPEAIPELCSASRDHNCSGILDVFEIAGPGDNGALHCTACNDPCDDTLFGDTLAPNATARCEYPEGLSEEEQLPASAVCIAGCNELFEDCNGQPADGCEVDLTQLESCGACDRMCSVGGEVTAVDCVAPEGTLDYDCAVTECSGPMADCDMDYDTGCEINTDTSLLHCGGCDLVCAGTLPHAVEACDDGACQVGTCEPPFDDCGHDDSPDGCETNLDTDPLNCGGCGLTDVYANATTTCEDGVLGYICLDGYDDCNSLATDGCEVELATNAEHCGACDHACTISHATPMCVAGACGIESCDHGWVDCEGGGGCETDASTESNCGACANDCLATEEYNTDLAQCVDQGDTFACECQDNAFNPATSYYGPYVSYEFCDGAQQICGASPDSGCPQAILSTSSTWLDGEYDLVRIGGYRPLSSAVWDEAPESYRWGFPPTEYRERTWITGFHVIWDDWGIIGLDVRYLGGGTQGMNIAVTPDEDVSTFGGDYGRYEILPSAMVENSVRQGYTDADIRPTGLSGYGEADVGCGSASTESGKIPVIVAVEAWARDTRLNDYGDITVQANLAGIRVHCVNVDIERLEDWEGIPHYPEAPQDRYFLQQSAPGASLTYEGDNGGIVEGGTIGAFHYTYLGRFDRLSGDGRSYYPLSRFDTTGQREVLYDSHATTAPFRAIEMAFSWDNTAFTTIP